MIFHWPQITLCALMILADGISLGKSGKPRTSNYSFWMSFAGTYVSVFILWKGGFFSACGG